MTLLKRTFLYNDLYENINVSFFTEYETLGRPYHLSQLEGHWCNTGHQAIVGPDGRIYPCNRFTEFSLFNQKARVIGHVDEGINFDKLRPFRLINLGNCSDEECIACDVAVGCGMCSGLSYDDSEVGAIFNRTKYICKMNLILLADLHDISTLGNYVEQLFKNNITRVNLVFDLSEISIDFDFDCYKAQLNKIADVLFEYFKAGQIKYINVLTDIYILEKMNNCNAGITHVTLGPDGKLYICPAFYYAGQPMESSGFSPIPRLAKLLDFKSAPICSGCDALHCRRCVYDNLIKTDEYNISGEVQCIISHIEREVSLDLQNRLLKETNFNSFKNILMDKDYIDPFTDAKFW
jgi:CXXX repeat peptide maturase